jgi:para-aminobenzoate synthetase component 1
MHAEAIKQFIDSMNGYGAAGVPFLFIIDYDLKKAEIHKLGSLPGEIKFSTPLIPGVTTRQIYTKAPSLKKQPVAFETYLRSFEKVINNIKLGNSYLVNLTFPTVVETESTLEEIFHSSVAMYKLLYYNKFVVFSPEIFVRIEGGEIKSFPMKGTIDASVPDAENAILNDEKEMAEHNTIVDLIRNDLSIFAGRVNVRRFRYIDKIATGEKVLLQVSSEIVGKLSPGYNAHLGDIIMGLLPAGSVTGAPKRETLRIIKESEIYERGWYTGVFGVFDGNSLDSAVMIRYIENDSGKLVYKSGGGITSLSDPRKEYEELISKVYVPVG